MSEETKPRPQAVFSNKPVKVTFSKRKYTRRNPVDEDSAQEFHTVYVDLDDDAGPADSGEAHLSQGEFDVEIYVLQSCQPYAFQILHAAERFFGTRDISIKYYD